MYRTRKMMAGAAKACGCRWLVEELPTETDTIPSLAIGEKAEVTHAVEAGGDLPRVISSI
ncbi:hypothetical protein MesoLj113b_68630 (plasmid) [Mesorhizobium sp. 113-3-3]|nr:hypothetical protein MesoLj113b_68630 [Mesorhizobium sp. 113-3-3]